jgi:hypothetical protein
MTPEYCSAEGGEGGGGGGGGAGGRGQGHTLETTAARLRPEPRVQGPCSAGGQRLNHTAC